LTFLSTIDAFIGGTLPRMEARIAAAPPAEALALAIRLRDASVNILNAAGDVNPLTDVVDDVKRLGADIARTTAALAKDATSDLTVIVVAVAVIAVVILARDLLR
jgi:hypothetical protein